ncbi:MAG: hypothetical protein KGH88_09050 [Thaumarchaeota archaeon]|nr:hypothetical protein [Nitrososphaerota archaeon]
MSDSARFNKKNLAGFRVPCRRGLATIVTTALMLTTVAVLGSALVAWSNGNLKVFETALSTTASNDTNKITESLAIENIVFCHSCNTTNGNNGNNVINVTLTNTGTVGVTVSQIQVNGTAIKNYARGTILPTNILPQNSYTVAAQLPTGVVWKSKSPDTITVTTARNSIYATQAAPP